eukprot:COSAG06_NODE_9812_length_1810_cov_4.002922_2_plen_51_part_00
MLMMMLMRILIQAQTQMRMAQMGWCSKSEVGYTRLLRMFLSINGKIHYLL